MAIHRKHADPIDRAIGVLDQKIATLQRQLREAQTKSTPNGVEGGRFPIAPVQLVTQFVKNTLRPNRQPATNHSHSLRQDLFDVTAEPLKELEAEPIAFASRTEPDLFTGESVAASGALETAEVVPPHQKLAHYLGAGSIKSYKPLKHVQRQIRNRFFMWLGLSFAALWIIWFVIR